MKNFPANVKVRDLTMTSSGERKIHAMLILGVCGWFQSQFSVDSSIPLILILGKTLVVLDSAEVVSGAMYPSSFAWTALGWRSVDCAGFAQPCQNNWDLTFL
jgi:hypothetical protein